jgi:hypothetical protein
MGVRAVRSNRAPNSEGPPILNALQPVLPVSANSRTHLFLSVSFHRFRRLVNCGCRVWKAGCLSVAPHAFRSFNSFNLA